MKKVIWVAVAIVTPLVLMYALSLLAFSTEWGGSMGGAALLLLASVGLIALLAGTFHWAFPDNWPPRPGRRREPPS